MTENNAAQPVLTDDEIRAVWVEHGLDDEAVEDFARAIESALLSKLRAPVADELPGDTRWPVLRAMARNYTAGKHTWDALDAEACEQAAEEIRHLRAALASAPTPKPWPVEEQPDGTVTPVDPVDMASAPVAGEHAAHVAGLEASINILSALVDHQRLLLVEVENVCGRDGHGGPLEDGESDLIDRVRQHLAATSPAAQPAVSVPVAGEAVSITDEAYAALQYVEGSLAAIANPQEVVGDVIERVDTIAAAAKRAKAALSRLQAVAHYFDAAPQASEAVRDAGIAASEDVELPPLPSPPQHRGHAMFAGSQMIAYARAAVLADRQQRAALSAQPGAQRTGGSDAE